MLTKLQMASPSLVDAHPYYPEVVQKYDEEHEVRSVVEKYSSVNSSKDRDITIRELVNNQVFDIPQ